MSVSENSGSKNHDSSIRSTGSTAGVSDEYSQSKRKKRQNEKERKKICKSKIPTRKLIMADLTLLHYPNGLPSVNYGNLVLDSLEEFEVEDIPEHVRLSKDDSTSSYDSTILDNMQKFPRSKPVNKTRWTKEENESLKRCVELYIDEGWTKIASFLPNRTDLQCWRRWQKVVSPSLVKVPWTKEEDQKVIELVEIYGAHKWTAIAKHLKGRIGNQCRERWHNHLNPDIKKTAWTAGEERKICEYHDTWGNQWAITAKLLPGRTNYATELHWNSTLKKRVGMDDKSSSFDNLSVRSNDDNRNDQMYPENQYSPLPPFYRSRSTTPVYPTTLPTPPSSQSPQDVLPEYPIQSIPSPQSDKDAWSSSTALLSSQCMDASPLDLTVDIKRDFKHEEMQSKNHDSSIRSTDSTAGVSNKYSQHKRKKRIRKSKKLTMADLTPRQYCKGPPSENHRNLVLDNVEEFEVEDTPEDTAQGKDFTPVSIDDNVVQHHTPKVTLTEEGDIVLDLSSLVVPVSKVSSKQRISQVAFDCKRPMKYCPRPKHWNKEETSQFYRALSMVGCEFSMMSKIFKQWELSRSEHELKLKFRIEQKREEDLVRKIVYEGNHFDFSLNNPVCISDVKVHHKDRAFG